MQEGIQLRVLLEERVRVLGIGGKPLQAIGDELAERTDVLILCGEDADLLRLLLILVLSDLFPRGRGETGGIGELCAKPVPLGKRLLDPGTDRSLRW